MIFSDFEYLIPPPKIKTGFFDLFSNLFMRVILLFKFGFFFFRNFKRS